MQRRPLVAGYFPSFESRHSNMICLGIVLSVLGWQACLLIRCDGSAQLGWQLDIFDPSNGGLRLHISWWMRMTKRLWGNGYAVEALKGKEQA